MEAGFPDRESMGDGLWKGLPQILEEELEQFVVDESGDTTGKADSNGNHDANRDGAVLKVRDIVKERLKTEARVNLRNWFIGICEECRTKEG